MTDETDEDFMKFMEEEQVDKALRLGIIEAWHNLPNYIWEKKQSG